MSGSARLALEAWESLFRAQVVISRRFAEDGEWSGCSPREYDVLYTLSKAPHGLRMTEIHQQMMLTQSGVSRLVARLQEHGLIERRPDPQDARAQCIVLTASGRELQREVGRRHARQVIRAMAGALEPGQLRTLRDLCADLVAANDAERPPSSEEKEEKD